MLMLETKLVRYLVIQNRSKTDLSKKGNLITHVLKHAGVDCCHNSLNYKCTVMDFTT